MAGLVPAIQGYGVDARNKPRMTERVVRGWSRTCCDLGALRPLMPCTDCLATGPPLSGGKRGVLGDAGSGDAGSGGQAGSGGDAGSGGGAESEGAAGGAGFSATMLPNGRSDAVWNRFRLAPLPGVG
jgi:hypothetical protein